MAKSKETKKQEQPIRFRVVTPSPEEIARARQNAHGLADSGARETSVTGALREPSPVDAGRYDLIPPEALSAVARAHGRAVETIDSAECRLAYGLERANEDDIASFVYYVVTFELRGWHRIAVHYARGAQKYADRNWEKGLETGRTVSSMYRHLDKAKRGLVDEDHWAAAVWNAIALINHIPRLKSGALPRELDTYGLLKRAGS